MPNDAILKINDKYISAQSIDHISMKLECLPLSGFDVYIIKIHAMGLKTEIGLWKSIDEPFTESEAENYLSHLVAVWKKFKTKPENVIDLSPERIFDNDNH